MGLFRKIRAGWQSLVSCLCVLLLMVSLSGCGDRPVESAMPQFNLPTEAIETPELAEVPTPRLISKLREELTQYQPQVQIISPQPNELLNSTTVAIQLQVNDLPLFKDEELGMGPHLHLFLDDQPYQAIYDVSEPLVLSEVAPGSHLLRVFAVRPWGESFKNEGAYAETTFSIFTENNIKLPDFSQPLLTYSSPQGIYGAEPIMLDFYLNDAPLHFVAQESEEDDIADWRIRVTINGDSFILDNWQPIYLTGFKEGENWLKLEFVDEQGELVENVYNNPVRVINYDPQVKDTLSKLVRNKISLRTAKKLVTTKELPPEIEPEVIEVEAIEPETIEPETTEPEIIESEASESKVVDEVEVAPEDVIAGEGDDLEIIETTEEINEPDVEVIEEEVTEELELDEDAKPEVLESVESEDVIELQEGEAIAPEVPEVRVILEEPQEVEVGETEGVDEAIAPEVEITTAEPDEPEEVISEPEALETEIPVQEEDIDVAVEEVIDLEMLSEPEELNPETFTSEELELVEESPEAVVDQDEVEKTDEAIAPEIGVTESVEEKRSWLKLPNILKAIKANRTTDSYVDSVE